MWVVKKMAPIIAVLISEGISWVILKVLRMVTVTLTLNMNCFFLKWKLLSLDYFVASLQSLEMLYSLRFTPQFLPWKQDGKKLYLLLSFTSWHLLFASLYVYIFHTLCFCFLFCHFHWVHIWFSRELIFLCGQNSNGFDPKFKVVFL